MMITRCPECNTSFRVTPEQLKAVQGKVRCGKCQHVFNAIETLLETTVEPNPDPAPLPDLLESDGSPGEPSLFGESFDDRVDDVAQAAEPGNETAWSPEVPSPEIEPLLHEDAPGRTSFTWVWAIAVLFASLLLALQAVLHYRVELGIWLPNSKPLLRALCKPFDCVLPLPKMVDLMSIESSDLRPAPDGPLILTATLKNRAGFAQAYPHLELTLTNTEDRAILRKVLAPEDYLPRDLRPESGFARNGEIAVSLAVTSDQVADATASGYRLYLFYP